MRAKANSLQNRPPCTSGLCAFIPETTPRFAPPVHLAELIALLEAAEREPVRALVSVPVRHGKTELLLHAIAWWLRRRPHITVGYTSYASKTALSKSRAARDYAQRAGVVVRSDAAALGEWRTPAGGGVIATGVGGPLTGYGVDVLLVDDPHKNRTEAESTVYRDRVHGWYTSTAVTRVEPGGSVFVVHARWHPDDLIGRLAQDGEVPWRVLNLPALRDDGTSLWPGRWSAAALERRRVEVGDYDWASLYQGQPRPRGGAVFGDVVLYDEPPPVMRVVVGVDFAYSARTSSDHSSAVVLGEDAGRYYVLEVLRAQLPAPAFASKLRALLDRYPGARVVSYVAGPERGVADLLSGAPHYLPIEAWPARADKFVRAQPVAAAWNRGALAVPRASTWSDAFVRELAAFTGLGDVHDDQVDALAAAYDGLAAGSFDLPDVALPRIYSY